MNSSKRNTQSQSKFVSEKSHRFLQFINRQLDKLKDERITMQLAADEHIKQLEIEVDNWVKGGQINQETFSKISNVLQQSMTFFIAKSVEIIGLQNSETSGERQNFPVSNVQELNLPYPSPAFKYKQSAEQSDMMLKEKKVPNEGAALKADNSHIITRLSILEEAVLSVKKKTEQVQQNQENVESMLDNFVTQQENVKKNITELEKIIQENASNAAHLLESISNIENRLNKLDEEKKTINVAINDVSREFTFFRTKTQYDLISIENFSKEVHSANEHYNEMSSKIKKLQVSVDILSTQHKEVCVKKYSQNKDTLGNLRDDLTSKVMDLSNKVTEIKSKCCRPSVGFYAFTMLSHSEGQFKLQYFKGVNANYGNHFDPTSGIFTAPISGLYLVSITAKLPDESSIIVLHPGHCEDGVCTLMGKQTITCCCELNEGDTISLQLNVKKELAKNWVDFSCCLINGF